jgi:hypothetical protein
MRYHTLLYLLLVPVILPAQSLPPYAPINPLVASRSPLYSQPVTGNPSGWSLRTMIDYSSAIESSMASDRRTYLLDAELLQADVWVQRRLTENLFALGNIGVRGGYAGQLDGFFNWYHDLVGLPVAARTRRAENRYAWKFALPDVTVERARPGTFISDLRLGVGAVVGPTEVVASIVLPTALTDAAGWSRNSVGVSLAASAIVVSQPRFTLEAGLSLGYSGADQMFAKYQREWFVGARAGMTWQFVGRQSLYASVWTQSAGYHDTDINAMEAPEVTIDFGGLLYLGRSWPQLQLGMTEDLYPRGAAIDAGFKLGVRW